MKSHSEHLIARAVDAHLLPASAHENKTSAHPWYVVAFSAVGAALVLVPMLAALFMLFGRWMEFGIGPYVVGACIFILSVVFLRSAGLRLFQEQIAAQTLLLGIILLCLGTFRDLPTQPACALLLALLIGLALALPQRWIKALLGFAALFTMLAMFEMFARSSSLGAWLSVHVGVALLYAAWAALGRLAPDTSKLHWADTLETFSSGWAASLLLALAFLSGQSFLIGAAPFSALARWHSGDGFGGAALGWQQVLVSTASSLLMLTGAWLAAKRWPSLRLFSFYAGAVLLAALAWFLPMLGALGLLLACFATSKRNILAIAALLAMLWCIGSFYYSLTWTLLTKAGVLVVLAILFAALAWLARAAEAAQGAMPLDMLAATQQAHPMGPRIAKWLIGLAGVATLLMLNASIWQKERLIATGAPMFVALAPVDPRSLMQGDYMALRFVLPAIDPADSRQRSERVKLFVVGERDARGIAHFTRIVGAEELPTDSTLTIALTRKKGRLMLVTDAWYFKEGDAKRWEAARYGEFRVDAAGRALLVGLANEGLESIQP